MPSDGRNQVDSSGSNFNIPEELQRLDYEAEIVHGPNARRKAESKTEKKTKKRRGRASKAPGPRTISKQAPSYRLEREMR